MRLPRASPLNPSRSLREARMQRETWMPEIGLLTEREGGVFDGRIRTLSHNLKLSLEPIQANDKRSGESPDFTVYAKVGEDLIPIGSAWKKESTRGADVTRFLSMTLDDPSFPAPLNVAAFPGNYGNTWPIVWNRPRQMREAA